MNLRDLDKAIEEKAWTAYLAWSRYFDSDERPAVLWTAMCRAQDELGEALKAKEHRPSRLAILLRFRP